MSGCQFTPNQSMTGFRPHSGYFHSILIIYLFLQASVMLQLTGLINSRQLDLSNTDTQNIFAFIEQQSGVSDLTVN